MRQVSALCEAILIALGLAHLLNVAKNKQYLFLFEKYLILGFFMKLCNNRISEHEVGGKLLH